MGINDVISKQILSALGLYSLIGKTSSQSSLRLSLEVVRFDVNDRIALECDRRQNYRGDCQFSEQLETAKPISRGFETSRDLAV